MGWPSGLLVLRRPAAKSDDVVAGRWEDVVVTTILVNSAVAAACSFGRAGQADLTNLLNDLKVLNPRSEELTRTDRSNRATSKREAGQQINIDNPKGLVLQFSDRKLNMLFWSQNLIFFSFFLIWLANSLPYFSLRNKC